MKNILKRTSLLALVLLLVLSLCATAFAAESTIQFTGYEDGFDFQPGSDYTDTDLFDNFKNVMPGDVLTETITFTNTSTDCDFIHLYMRAIAHDESANPLSEKVGEVETVATMSDFLSQLSMKVWNGAELIYSASPDQLDGLSKNVYLGTFRKGDTATLTVELTVPLDLGNEYANRVGEVDWVFHVEAYNESQLSVRKVWSDGNSAHEGESISVNLLKDGVVEDTVELNDDNGWAYTFDRLVEGHTWTVEEAEVPEGYTVSYETTGTAVTIVNTADEPEPSGDPLDITVKKVWSDDNSANRPTSVTVTLYNGTEVYDTVTLSAENNWTYHWEDASVLGNWQIAEVNISKGYTPSYRVSDGVITITNTLKLIQTGQLNWPIFLLGGVGLVLVALGATVTLGKKRKNA